MFPRGLVRSAGAVAWRPKQAAQKFTPGKPIAPKQLEVLLVHRPRYKDWSWPKGKVERDEPIPVAAVREVEEETGALVALGTPLMTQRYRLGSGHLKEVYYWTGTLDVPRPAQATRVPAPRASKKEIDIAKWVSPDRAREMLTRRGDRRLLTELVNRAARGELITSATVLLRHADAVDRLTWGSEELTRPLNRLGATQALDLVPLLSAFGVGKVYSSPWARCAQTVAPYVALGRGKYEEEECLTEEGAVQHPAQSAALVERLLERGRGAQAVCLHRPGYPALLDPVREITPRRLIPTIENPKPGLRKSEMLIAHVAHGTTTRVLAVEKQMPLTKSAIGL